MLRSFVTSKRSGRKMRIGARTNSQRAIRLHAAIESLERRQLLAANLSVSNRVVFNDPIGGAASPPLLLVISNTGDAPLTIPFGGFTFTGLDAAQFKFSYAPPLPLTLAPGASTAVYPVFNPQSTTAGLKVAQMQISSDDPNHPATAVDLRALATTGTGGANEPSLQRIMDLYQIPDNVGDDNPDDTVFPATPVTPNDERAIQRLKKAGPGPVSIRPLATFGISHDPVMTFGYYTPGDISKNTPLFNITRPDAQWVNPAAKGSQYFDPGTNTFALYSDWPSLKNSDGSIRRVFSEDAFNTWEPSVPNQHKMRFYPYKNADGSIVPNSYVVAEEEFTPDYDQNDFVFLIRNVTPDYLFPEPVIGLTNSDGTPYSDRLVMNRQQSQNTAINTVASVFHDNTSLTIRNTGDAPLYLSGASITAGSSDFTLVSGPAPGTAIAPGGFTTATVKFVGQTGDLVKGKNYVGTLTIASNDIISPTISVHLVGRWQSYPNTTPPPGAKYTEPTLQEVVSDFGYSTQVLTGTQTLDTGGATTPVGEEVLSNYWRRADPNSAVTIREIASFHSSGATVAVKYFDKTSLALHSLFSTKNSDYQTYYPRNTSSAPSLASFSPSGAFGFKVDSEWSLDSQNTTYTPGGEHNVRFYPARNLQGLYIANTWIVAQDYNNGAGSQNFDFQDNIFIVTNMKPELSPAAPFGLGGVSFAGGTSAYVAWTPNPESDLASYNVYRSLSPTSGFTAVATGVTGNSFSDTTLAGPGITYYYRVTAVNTSGVESIPAQSQTLTEAADLISKDVGTVATGGVTNPIIPNSAYNVWTGGNGIKGTADSFQFGYTTKTLDFDVRVHINRIDAGNSNTVGGLMIRDSLNANAKSIFVGAQSNGGAFVYSVRSNTGGSTTTTTAGTVSYPGVWVRLTRLGNQFTAQTSPDGATWTQIGTTYLPLNAALFFGLATASGTGSGLGAQYTNFGM